MGCCELARRKATENRRQQTVCGDKDIQPHHRQRQVNPDRSMRQLSIFSPEILHQIYFEHTKEGIQSKVPSPVLLKVFPKRPAMRPFPIAGSIKTVLKEKRGRFGRPLYRQRIRELAQDRFANRYRLKLDLAVFFQGSSLLFEGSEAGLMQGVFHRAAPIPGRVDDGLVEHGAEAF